jgi:uncharacterized protein YdaU (DUF1376 family)
MSALPYMPWFIGDYFADTMHLTRDQHGGYLLLLAAMWNGGGSLPNEPAVLGHVTKATPEEWERLALVLMPFFKIVRGRLVSKRLAKELERTNKVRESRRQSSQQAVIARALKKAGISRPHSSNGMSNDTSNGLPNGPSNEPPFDGKTEPNDIPNELPNDAPNVQRHVGISREERKKEVISSDGEAPAPLASLRRAGARSLAATSKNINISDELALSRLVRKS